MKRLKNEKSSISLTLLFAGLTFFILLISVAVAGILIYALTKMHVWQGESAHQILMSLLFMALVSLVVGTLIAMLAVRIPLKPINWMIHQMNRLAAGDFEARLHFDKPLGMIPAFAEVEESFNKMATELENTEMLRSDFINNVSHEFKTPIVSITGFAKLLQKGNLEPGQQQEYIDAIAEESKRLSYLAANVLNLTKVENQEILTDLTEFNLSEQIRSALLLLETNWSKKNLELDINLPEVSITANEDLLKQVWINLLQNAVKFSPEYAPLRVHLVEHPDRITVCVANIGSIPAEDLPRIWNKFYQADKSHSGEGNGIGLAIVKRIVELHKGTAEAACQDGFVIFSVSLPR